MKNVLITGAASRIGEATAHLIAKELKPKRMILTDRPGANLEKVAVGIMNILPSSRVDVLPVDLADIDEWSKWDNLPPLSGLVLCAAAGLTPGVTRRQMALVNLHSQTALAAQVFHNHADPKGCHAVFINSLWGHNRTRKFPHEAYEPIAMDKNKAEDCFRRIGRDYGLPYTFNIVVSSMVARTFASILVKKTLSKEDFAKLIESLPEHREVLIEEAARGILEALKSPQTGQTIFVPPSAREWASAEMLSVST